MKLKHIFALLLVGIAFVGCQKEGIGPENSKEKKAAQARKQLFQDLSSLAAANRMLALTDFKSTSEKLTSKDLERTDADIDRLIEYFFRANHTSTLQELIVRYTVDKDSRFMRSNADADIADYEAKVRELRAQAIFAMWSCTMRDSLFSKIEAYQKRRSQLFLSTSAGNQAHDSKVSAPSWYKAKYLKSAKVYKVTLITPDGEFKIDCRDDEYILDAAEDNGISLPCSSRCGADPSSTALLVSGSIDQSDQCFLDRDQMDKGFVLLDVAYPKSDCTLLTHMEEHLYDTPMTGNIDELVIPGERPYNPDPNTNPDPNPDTDPNDPNGGFDPIIFPDPNAKRPLTPSEKKKVDQAKDEVNKRGCGANMAYNMVNPNWGNYKVVMDPNLNGQAGYLNGTFYFKDLSTIDAKYLTEEFIHAAQDLTYSNGIYQYKREGKINIEFEAKLLAEINNVANGGCCYNAQLFMQGETLLRFMSDLRSWINNGTVNIEQYNSWLSYWENYPGNEYKGTGNIKDGMQPLLFNEFLKQMSNCIKSTF